MSGTTNTAKDIAEVLSITKPARGNSAKLWLLASAMLAVGATLAIAASPAERTDVAKFKTQQVQRGDMTIVVSATGKLKPTEEVDVGSELSGIVKSVEVDYNASVEVGQLLARLDTSKIKAQVTQAKATMESARAKVLQAQATVKESKAKLSQLQRLQRISSNTMPAQTDLDVAEATHERALAELISAQASVLQAQANLELSETDLGKADIRSPVDGIVLTRSIEPGQTVAASFQAPVLFTLAKDLRQMALHVDVDEADVGKVKEGQEATFTVDAYPDRTFRARIVRVHYAAQSVENVVTYETVLQVDNSDLALRPGMTATAEIIVKKIDKAMLVPNVALRFAPPEQEQKKPSGGLIGSLLPRPPQSPVKQRQSTSGDKNQQRVWVLEQGEPAAVWITTGATNGIMTEVVKGNLEPGLRLVVDTIDAGE